MKLRLFLIYTALFIFMPAAGAQENALFCPALRQPQSYTKELLSYKMLIEGNDGWAFRTEDDLRPHFEMKDKTVALILKFQQTLEKQGITLIILHPPTRGLVAHNHLNPTDAAAFGYADPVAVWREYESMTGRMRAAGIHIVGLPRAQAEGRDIFYPRDHHWNAAGAEMAAGALAAYIKTLPVYAALEKTPFTTAEKETIDYRGSWDKAFRKICGAKLPPQKIKSFETSRAQAAETAADLFGDAAQPQVVLAGTSNSTAPEPSFANFEGFLKQTLSADILNMSVPGAGIDTALHDWFGSDHKKSGRAKIVIWEIPGNYELDRRARMLRQLIAEAAGDCGGGAVQSAQSVAFRGREAVLFDGIGASGISGDRYYIYLKFEQALKQDFEIGLTFRSAEDKTAITRSKRAKAGSEYALLLKEWKQGPLQKVSLIAPADMNGAIVNAKICKMP